MAIDINYMRVADFYKDMIKKDRFLLFIILLVLYRKPRSVYQIIKRVRDRSGHSVAPSSVSAKMKYLESKGYIKKGQPVVIQGRNQYQYSLTDKGKKVVESFSKTLQNLM